MAIPHLDGTRLKLNPLRIQILAGVFCCNARPGPFCITTLNETIDLDASRVAASRNHVPGVVWLLLMVVAGCGSWASAYGSGAVGPRSAFSQFVFPILIGIVITLIADIDRPQKGLIGISQVPLEELLESMVPASGS